MLWGIPRSFTLVSAIVGLLAAALLHCLVVPYDHARLSRAANSLSVNGCMCHGIHIAGLATEDSMSRFPSMLSELHLHSESNNNRALYASSHVRVVLNDRLE